MCNCICMYYICDYNRIPREFAMFRNACAVNEMYSVIFPVVLPIDCTSPNRLSRKSTVNPTFISVSTPCILEILRRIRRHEYFSFLMLCTDGDTCRCVYC
jgi:hypothetical protein